MKYRMAHFSPTSRPRRTIKKLLLKIKSYINAHPKLKIMVMCFLNRFPTLKARLKSVGQPDLYVRLNHIEAPEQLSPWGRKIYINLNDAFARRQKENN